MPQVTETSLSHSISVVVNICRSLLVKVQFSGVNVENGIVNVGPTSASRRAAFETSIRQMVATFCIFCKCAG